VSGQGKPMSHQRRLANYGAQEKFSGTLLDLTPRQRRRVNHKRNHAAARARKS
jgi:hypothetical protein